MNGNLNSRFNRSPKMKFQGQDRLNGPALLVPRHRGVVQSLSYMADNLNRPILVKDLVPASAMSRRGFFKAFKKHTGRTPGEELEITRIEQSKKIIMKGRCKMKDLAKLCGYRKVNTFYVAFKRVVGTSPGKFQKQYSH